MLKRRLFAGALAAAAATLAFAAPALAHGDHDARPLARQLAAGPYSISLWQVYPDVGSAMTPHLIVMFEGGARPPGAVVTAAKNSTPMHIQASPTTASGWETMEGVAEGDTVHVTISDGAQTWDLGPVVVPPPPTSFLPMQELIYSSIFLTVCTALWVSRRTARAWRRPQVRPIEQPAT